MLILCLLVFSYCDCDYGSIIKDTILRSEKDIEERTVWESLPIGIKNMYIYIID